MSTNDKSSTYVTNVEGPYFNNILEPADEVTDDDSVENFKVSSNPLQNSTSSCASNLTVTPFRDTYMENNEFLSQLNGKTIKVPIVGYEIMEERARFTVYKLRVEQIENGNPSWVVYRRYTDFVRLCNSIKTLHPNIAALLPRKRWFGNNFDPDFLNERIRGLQQFINGILETDDLLKNTQVQDFLCLNESALDTEQFLEDSRAICDALSETIYHLRNQLKDKDMKIIELNEKLYAQELTLSNCIEFIKNQTLNCSNCSEKLNENLKKLVQNQFSNDKSSIKNQICDNDSVLHSSSS